MNETKPIDQYLEVMIQKAAIEMQKFIDEGVMHGILVEDGWIKVKFDYTSNKQAIEILDWCSETFKGKQWHRGHGYFIFRKKKDAEWFILRWL